MTDLEAREDTALLQVSATTDGRVNVSGELDIASGTVLASSISELLADAQCGSVRLNLSAVRFIDCAGLGVLLQARAEALAVGKEVVVERAGERVRQFLRRTGTAPVLLRQ